jgi:hypothetical protein
MYHYDTLSSLLRVFTNEFLPFHTVYFDGARIALQTIDFSATYALVSTPEGARAFDKIGQRFIGAILVAADRDWRQQDAIQLCSWILHRYPPTTEAVMLWSKTSGLWRIQMHADVIKCAREVRGIISVAMSQEIAPDIYIDAAMTHAFDLLIARLESDDLSFLTVLQPTVRNRLMKKLGDHAVVAQLWEFEKLADFMTPRDILGVTVPLDVLRHWCQARRYDKVHAIAKPKPLSWRELHAGEKMLAEDAQRWGISWPQN